MTESTTDRIVIACAADAAWVRPLAAMVQSVLVNHRTTALVDIFVLTRSIGAADRERMSTAWGRHGATTRWLDPPDSRFAGVPLWGRMPVTTYYKVVLAELLPADVHRVIWLDSDVIMLGDVARLWAHDLGGCLACAAQDRIVPLVSSTFGLRHWARLGFTADARYFNAGVMLIDVDGWRTTDVAATALEYLRRFQHDVYFWDQEGLNAALAGQWRELDERWNCNMSVPGAFERLRNGHGSGAPQPGESPWVLHYSGNLKPWRYRTRDPRRLVFFEYLDQTPWAGWRPPASALGTAIGLYEASGLRRAVYPVERLVVRLLRATTRRSVAPPDAT